MPSFPPKTSDQYVAVTESREINAGDLARNVDCDPAGGTIVLTVPAALGRGFFFRVRQVGPGTVMLASGPGASIIGLGGPNPTLFGVGSSASVDNSTSGNVWFVDEAPHPTPPTPPSSVIHAAMTTAATAVEAFYGLFTTTGQVMGVASTRIAPFAGSIAGWTVRRYASGGGAIHTFRYYRNGIEAAIAAGVSLPSIPSDAIIALVGDTDFAINDTLDFSIQPEIGQRPATMTAIALEYVG